MLMGIQGTHQEKQRKPEKAQKHCVRNDFADFDGYSGDTPITYSLCTKGLGGN